MKEDFSLGLRELEEELRDEGDGDADTVKHHSPSDAGDGVEVFTVCSKAYQKFRGRLPLEEWPTGFETPEDTSIPELIQHCREFTLDSRERLVDIFLADLGRLRKRMREWSDNTTPDREMAIWQRDLMQVGLKEHHANLKEVR
jgi:hypothetical protein